MVVKPLLKGASGHSDVLFDRLRPGVRGGRGDLGLVNHFLCITGTGERAVGGVAAVANRLIMRGLWPGDDGLEVRCGAIANFDSLSIEDGSVFVVWGKVFIYEFKK